MRSAIVVGAAIWSQQWARLAMWLGPPRAPPMSTPRSPGFGETTTCESAYTEIQTFGKVPCSLIFEVRQDY